MLATPSQGSNRTDTAKEKNVMSKVVVISGASSGFGALSARALADAGNTVYASIRETAARNAGRVAEARACYELD
jgi:NADP-dependent 3-hydroxy acid dehydrogenase YdfG